MNGSNLSILLDSVILIDHLNGVVAATSYLRLTERASISVITRAEVLSGVDSESRANVERLLERYVTLPLDREAADLAAELRRAHRWKLPDAFQAALAQRHGLRLATRNTKDFPASLPFVIVPYSIR
jgi:predicted nucleic acid-binding protein